MGLRAAIDATPDCHWLRSAVCTRLDSSGMVAPPSITARTRRCRFRASDVSMRTHCDLPMRVTTTPPRTPR